MPAKGGLRAPGTPPQGPRDPTPGPRDPTPGPKDPGYRGGGLGYQGGEPLPREARTPPRSGLSSIRRSTEGR